MIPFLRHHIDRAARGEKYNALSHCHIPNLHSIVLHDEPGNRVRMFYADYGHSLSLNRHDPEFSLAIHAHHCAVRFAGLFGDAFNEVYALTPHATGAFAEMAYRSGITQGESSLTPTGRRATVHRIRSENLMTNPVMAAHEMHTIYAGSGKHAWLVFEGAEDQHYESVCWTNNPSPDLSALYEPMDSERVRYLLEDTVQRMDRARA